MLNTQIFMSVALLIAYFFQNELKSALLNAIEKKKQVDWIIGILSSPDNFERRAIIRQTWLSYLNDLNSKVKVKPYFIIGEGYCNLTWSIRANNYSCDEVKLAKSVKRPNFLVNKLVDSNPKGNNYIYRGFIFEVNVDITINRFGALSSALKELEHIKIFLLDLYKDEIIAQISQKKNGSLQLEDYIYFDLEQPLELKKGFVGQIWLHEIKNYEQLKKFQSIRNDDLNLVTIIGETVDSYMNISQFTENVLFTTSFDYALTNKKDIEINLNHLAADEESIRGNFHRLQAKLALEASIHNDIKLLDNVDTYRNLPDKLLKFLQYVNSQYSFKYFIKVDDDSFLNIPKILKKVRTDGHKLWLGNFRKNWKVNRFGKWSETNYQAVVYPPFPCGSAYMLSSDLITWLSANSGSLFRYQGEDVSMGIWLAAILPIYEHDERWSCQNAFHRNNDNFFSYGQLSTEEQVAIFKRNKHPKT